MDKGVDVLSQEEYRPVRSAVLHEWAANHFRFREVDIERRPANLSKARDEEHEEGQRLDGDVRDALLRFHDVHDVQRVSEHRHAKQGEDEWYLVAHELRR